MNISFSTIPNRSSGKRASVRRPTAAAHGVVSRFKERWRDAVTAMRDATRAIAAARQRARHDE
jgi:hypothetical protein